MHVRYFAFLLPAALITGLIFSLTSSIVSALEVRFIRSPLFETIQIARHETDCEFLERRIEQVAVDLRSCQALPGCLESQNVCPPAMLEDFGEEYARLRNDVLERCSDVPTYATRVSATCSRGVEACETDRCGMTPTSLDQGPASARPATFVF